MAARTSFIRMARPTPRPSVNRISWSPRASVTYGAPSRTRTDTGRILRTMARVFATSGNGSRNGPYRLQDTSFLRCQYVSGTPRIRPQNAPGRVHAAYTEMLARRVGTGQPRRVARAAFGPLVRPSRHGRGGGMIGAGGARRFGHRDRSTGDQCREYDGQQDYQAREHGLALVSQVSVSLGVGRRSGRPQSELRRSPEATPRASPEIPHQERGADAHRASGRASTVASRRLNPGSTER
jgi:hypothetical protein